MSWLNYDAINLATRDFVSGGKFLQDMKVNYKLDILSANVVYAENQAPFIESFVVKKLDQKSTQVKLPFKDITIGIIGFCDQKEKLLNRRVDNEPELSSAEPIQVAQKLIPRLKKRSDLVVLLFNGRFKNLQPLLESSLGIDVVIMGGEYYRADNYTGKDIILASNPSLGKYISALNIELDKNKRIISTSKTQVPLDENIKDDEKFVDLLNEFDQAKNKLANANLQRSLPNSQN